METFRRYYIAEQKADGSLTSTGNSERYATIEHAKRDPMWGHPNHVVVEGHYQIREGTAVLIERAIVAMPEQSVPDGSELITIAGRTANVPADVCKAWN